MYSRARLILCVLALLSTGCATNRWANLGAHDARELVTAPARISAETWKRTALVAGGIAATAALDESIREAAAANTSDAATDASEIITPFGGRYSDRVMLGFLAAGLIGKNERAKAVAFDAFVSSVVASKIVTPVLKSTIGRDRPNVTDDAFQFHGGSAFPSNHATQAFAVASVIAAHYESPWVDAAAYGLATLVGAARVYDNVHWFSDTVAGAAIGTVTGRFIVATNKRYRSRWMVMPVYDRERRGVMIRIETVPF